MTKTFTFISFFLILSLGALALLTYTNALKLYIVKSGSMAPAISVNSLVLTIPTESVFASNTYQRGDIISFKRLKNGVPITHRITDIHITNGQPAYTVKGDANESADQFLVPHKSVVGKAAFWLPYIGSIPVFIASPIGVLLLVILPASVVIFHELSIIAEEVRKNKRKIDTYTFGFETKIGW